MLDGPFEDYFRPRSDLVEVIHSETLPVREISGIALHDNKVYLVGDYEANLAVSAFDGQRLSEPVSYDFSQSIISRFAPCDSFDIVMCRKISRLLVSQWEAIAVDGHGRIFLLNEQLATIFVYSPDAQNLLGVINLSSFQTHERQFRHRAGAGSDNALGEGLVLLNQGHILVAKERARAAIFEFAPHPGAKPVGSRRVQLRPQQSFDVDFSSQDRQTYYPIKRWVLGEEFRDCDLSELTFGPDGALYALSQQCQWISQLADLGSGEDKIRVVQKWQLPLKIHKAEGLAVLAPGNFLVSQDSKSETRANLFWLRDPAIVSGKKVAAKSGS